MKNILVPTDFSSHAQWAIDAAENMAKKNNACIHLVHTIKSIGDIVQLENFASGDFSSTVISSEQIIQLIDLKVKDAEAALNQMANNLKNKNLICQTHVLQQSVESAIEEVCKENPIDLIIMGSHGASGISELLIGSNAQKVVRNSNCPVLIIKQPLTTPITKMVFASGFNEPEISHALTQAETLAKKLDAQLHFLFVNTPGYFEDTETSFAKMKQATAQIKNAEIHIYNDFSVEDGILAFAKNNQFNGICIATHGYKSIRRFFNNNIVEHLVNHCNIPVISFRSFS